MKNKTQVYYKNVGRAECDDTVCMCVCVSSELWVSSAEEASAEKTAQVCNELNNEVMERRWDREEDWTSYENDSA